MGEATLPSTVLLGTAASPSMLHKFHEDLERIGLRRRRQYDSRRTFISLAQCDPEFSLTAAYRSIIPTRYES